MAENFRIKAESQTNYNVVICNVSETLIRQPQRGCPAEPQQHQVPAVYL